MISTKSQARWSSGGNGMVDFVLIKSAFGVITTSEACWEGQCITKGMTLLTGVFHAQVTDFAGAGGQQARIFTKAESSS